MRENTAERWGSVQIALHWTIAALVLLVQVPAGITMAAVDPGPVQNVCYNIHKTNGIVIFLLALVRLGWRWAHPVPLLPADMPEWQAKLARTTHALLYLVLFLMPITGFLYTAMGGFPVPFFMVYDLAQVGAGEQAGRGGLQVRAPDLAVRALHHGPAARRRRALPS